MKPLLFLSVSLFFWANAAYGRCLHKPVNQVCQSYQLENRAVLSLRSKDIDEYGKARVLLFYVINGKKTPLIDVTADSPQWSTIVDFNGDKKPEFILKYGCGGTKMGCHHIIYSLNLDQKNASIVLKYWGIGSENRYGNYLSILDGATASNHYHALYKIVDFENLQFNQSPLRVDSEYDERTGKHVCRLPFRSEFRHVQVVKEIIKSHCQKGATIKMGEAEL
jgi:hypothetical protein